MMISGIADRSGPAPGLQRQACASSTGSSASDSGFCGAGIAHSALAECHPARLLPSRRLRCGGWRLHDYGFVDGLQSWRILPDQVPRRPPTHIGTAKCPRQVANGWFAQGRSSAILVNSRDRGGWLGGLCGHRRSWRRGVTRRLRPFPSFVRMRAAVIRANCGMGPVIEGQG